MSNKTSGCCWYRRVQHPLQEMQHIVYHLPHFELSLNNSFFAATEGGGGTQYLDQKLWKKPNYSLMHLNAPSYVLYIVMLIGALQGEPFFQALHLFCSLLNLLMMWTKCRSAHLFCSVLPHHSKAPATCLSGSINHLVHFCKRRHSPNTVRAGTDSLFSQKETWDSMTVMMHGR